MVDTNILVYASDPAAGEKRVRALQLLEELIDSSSLVVSAQVLNELYVAITRPNKPPSLPYPEARHVLDELAASSEVLPLTAATTFRALDGVARHGFSFWDALIWAAAKENGVHVIYTEDFQHGREVEGVRFVNPFVTVE